MREQPKILLVVSAEPRRLVTATAASEYGVVIEARNCQEGRSAVGRYSDIAVIVSDLTLSDGSWWCMHRAIVEQQPAAELIVLIPAQESDVSEIEAYGAIVLSGNPLTEEQVAQALGEALRKRQRTVGRTPL